MKKINVYFVLFLLVIISLTYNSNFVNAATLFSDNFEDGAVADWTTQYGAWSVVKNSNSYVFYQSSTKEGRAWTGNTTWTDYSITAKVKVTNFNGSNRAYVCARMTDGNNYYAASLCGKGTLELRKKVKGSSTTLVSKEFTLATNTWYTVQLVVNGTTLQMYVNGTLQLTAADNSLSSGGIGVIAYKVTAMFDEISVTEDNSTATASTTTSNLATSQATAQTDATSTQSSISDTVTSATSLVGFATQNGGTSGGAGGTTVTVYTGTDLAAAIKLGGPRIIYVAGTISASNSGSLEKFDVKNVSDISIIGVGTSGVLNGLGIKINKASNIIIRNLKIHNVTADTGDGDCIGVEGPANNIWIDHCELYNDLNHDKDYYDGLLDVKKASAYITISWCYFHDSYKTSLVGSSDSDDYDRKITYHHNYFKNCSSRVPSYRFGTGHIYNNYYSNVTTSGINCRMGATLRIEGNVFENCKRPITFLDSDETGYWNVKDNLFTNCTGSQPTTSTCSFTPSYSYKADSASSVKATVTANVGVGKL